MPLLDTRTRRRIAAFDQRVDAAFDRLRGHPVADRLFYTASTLGDHSLIWLLLGAARGVRSEHDWHAAVRVGGVLAVESALVNIGIKSLFRRTRPPWEVHPHPMRLRKPRSSSFPSGHATSAFCAAVLLSEDDSLAPLYVVAAGVVAASRVYVKIHHASDVMAGVPLGLLIGAAGRRLLPLPARPAAVGSA